MMWRIGERGRESEEGKKKDKGRGGKRGDKPNYSPPPPVT
jgi:hypothetical protein